ncbi:MAG: tRNA (adenosine(37)-N6)-dimethylallyltransferase MiaA [Elusimicrobiota bacterium]|nr:tRNA (adenosine(37)-N6)-dimethylallyltransferase MiaA [Elusimicrobiota bacterium]
MKDVIVITGPTAAGKSGLAHKIARAAGGEIIVADSVKVYKGADIGASKPTAEKLKEVKYHLLDIIEPDQRYDVGRFYRDSIDIIEKLHQKDRLPVVAGGTPLYITKLTEGLADIPALKEETRKELSQFSTSELYSRLEKADPERASELHPHMRKRILRALGVYMDIGRKMSELYEETKVPSYDFIKLYVSWPREELYERIEMRVEKMFKAGLVEEVKTLLKNFGSDAPVFEGVGYSETTAYLAGDLTLEEAKEEMKKNTRHYARKQLTWWRNRNLVCLDGEKLKTERVI